MPIVLSIDTASNKEVIIGLEKNSITDTMKKPLASHSDQIILPLINEILQKHSLTLNDLTSITVVTGPGSFTGLRVGVAIANALGYLLTIPVNGKLFSKDSSLVEPTYSV